MQIDLTGKTALVTGSTTGIGYAIAVGLAQAGGPREQGASIMVPQRTQSFGRFGAWIKETFL